MSDGVSFRLYVGPAISVTGGKELSYDERVFGCPRCNARRIGNFCSICGVDLTNFNMNTKIYIENIFDVVDVMVEKGRLSDGDRFEFQDNFYRMPCSEYVIPVVNLPNMFSAHVDSEEHFTIPSETEINNVIEHVKNTGRMRDVLLYMDRVGIGYKIEYKVISNCN